MGQPATVTAPKEPEGEPPSKPPESPPAKSEPASLSWIFVSNLLVVGALGVAISWWLLHYTDRFESAASIFALTGVFSWLAAVSRILPGERIESLQSVIDRRVMNSRIALVAFLLIGAVCAYWAGGRGTIQIDSRRDAADRSVTVAGRGAVAQLTLEPGGHVRTTVATSWSTPASFVVKVSGYPDKKVVVRPWQRLSLTVPTSFYRPVVLIKPSVRLLNQRGQEMPIKVFLNGAVVSDGSKPDGSKFEGYSFWLGGDEDLSIPISLLDGWRAELATQNKPLSMRYYETPVVLSGERLELKPGDRLAVELLKHDGSTFLRKEVTVKPFTGPQDFPQVEELNEPRTETPSQPPPT